MIQAVVLVALALLPVVVLLALTIRSERIYDREVGDWWEQQGMSRKWQ